MRLDELRPQDVLGLKDRNWTSKELVDHLQSIGAEPIGDGGAAEVWAHQKLGNLVLRIAHASDTGWVEWAKYCYLNQRKNPHCMRVASVIPQGYWFFCVMERMKFDRDRFQELAKQSYRRYATTSREFKWAIGNDITVWLEDDSEAPDRLEKFITDNGGKPLGQCLWDIGTMGKRSGAILDLHFGNWGFRGKTLVITDPLYSSVSD